VAAARVAGDRRSGGSAALNRPPPPPFPPAALPSSSPALPSFVSFRCFHSRQPSARMLAVNFELKSLRATLTLPADSAGPSSATVALCSLTAAPPRPFPPAHSDLCPEQHLPYYICRSDRAFWQSRSFSRDLRWPSEPFLCVPRRLQWRVEVIMRSRRSECSHRIPEEPGSTPQPPPDPTQPEPVSMPLRSQTTPRS
jgi:hypothetical protein